MKENPRSKNFGVRLSPIELEMVQACALRDKRTAGDWARLAILAAVDRDQRKLLRSVTEKLSADGD
jgi:hypothetical protein